jgi:hypothetical protein
MTGTMKNTWSRWLILAEKIGDLITFCVLLVCYFTLFLIPSLYFTVFADTVGKKYKDRSYFEDLQDRNDTLEDTGEMS